MTATDPGPADGRLLTTEEVMDRLQVKLTKIHRLRKQGLLRAIKIGSNPRAPVRFRESDVDAFLEASRETTRS